MSDLCGRCLVVVDARMAVVAHFGREKSLTTAALSPHDLAAWVERQGIAGADRFSIGPQGQAFEPVSTWHGDPVCSWHLYELVDRERRQQ